ncbi:unnamed protein product, partial [Closterium sp. Naga37s-1]
AMAYNCPDCPARGFTTRGNLTNHRISTRCPGSARHAASGNAPSPFVMSRQLAASMVSPTLSLPSPTPSMPSSSHSTPVPPPLNVNTEPSTGDDGSNLRRDNMIPDTFQTPPSPSSSMEGVPDVMPDDATSSHADEEADGTSSDGEESPPFVFLDAWAHWLLTCGVSHNKIDELFKIFRHPNANLEEVAAFKNARDVEKYALSRAPDSHRNWKKARLRLAGKPHLEYFYCDAIQGIKDLLTHPKLAPKLVLKPTPRAPNKPHVYSTPETGDWWHTLDEEIKKEDPSGVVCALIIASDETHMDQRGKAKGHPVYLTLANIDKDDRWKPFGHVLLALLPEYPSEYDSDDKLFVFQHVMNIVLEPLRKASHHGIPIVDETGASYNAWPALYAYVADYPETCKVSCTKSGATSHPCSICTVFKDNLSELIDHPKPRVAFMQQTIVSLLQRRSLPTGRNMELSTHSVKCFLWGWRFESHALLSPYLCLMPDIMHQADLGILEYIVDAIRAQCKEGERELIDVRLKFFRTINRNPHLRLPAGAYFARGASYQAYEHRSVMQILPFLVKGYATDAQIAGIVAYIEWYSYCARVSEHTEASLRQLKLMASRMLRGLEAFTQSSNWNIIKVHLVSHYIDAIRRAGLPEHYCAQLFEHLHTEYVKNPYRASNKRNATAQVMNAEVNRLRLQYLAPQLGKRKRYDTALLQ